MIPRSKAFRKIGSLFLAIFLVAALSTLAAHLIDLQNLIDYANSFGNLMPLALLILIIISSSIGLLFMIPVAAAAFIMDIYSAFFISVIGLILGAIISFFASRYLGRDYFERRFVHRIGWLKRYDEHLEKKGFLTVLFLRLISFIPYELVNIGGGLSRVSAGAFLAATALGIIPGTMLTIYFVKNTNSIGSPQFAIATLLLAAFFLIPLLFKKVREIVFND